MSAPTDAHGGLDGSTMGKAFGQPCAMDSECQSQICFHESNRSYCSMRCMQATAAMDCPVPPTLGICNMQGYCKAP